MKFVGLADFYILAPLEVVRMQSATFRGRIHWVAKEPRADIIWNDEAGIGKGLVHVKGIFTIIKIAMFGTQVEVRVHMDQVGELVFNT